MKTGKQLSMSIDEMSTDMISKKEENLSNNRESNCYKVVADKHKQSKLKELLYCKLPQAVDFAEKKRISLEDIEELQARTIIYLRLCAETGTFPSSSGLARSIGYTDHTFRNWRNYKPDTPTGQWLQMFNEMCGEILYESALTNNVNPTYAMFVNKSLRGYIDRSELLLTPNTPPPSEEEIYSAEDIRKRYLPHDGEKNIVEDEGGC